MGDKCCVYRGLSHRCDVRRPFLRALGWWLLPLLWLLLVHPFQFPQLFGLPGCEGEQHKNQVSTESWCNPGFIENGSRSIISKFSSEKMQDLKKYLTACSIVTLQKGPKDACKLIFIALLDVFVSDRMSSICLHTDMHKTS